MQLFKSASLLNPAGQTLMKSLTGYMQVSTIPAGIYFLKIDAANTQTLKKIIIIH